MVVGLGRGAGRLRFKAASPSRPVAGRDLTPYGPPPFRGTLKKNRHGDRQHDRPTQPPDHHGPGGAGLPPDRQAGQARGRPDQADGDAARPVSGLFARRRGTRSWPSPRIPTRAFDYTTRGNMVAVISNGTAILGLGNLGALASQAGDGGQGGPVQALRRRRLHRPRGRHRGSPTRFIDGGALSSGRPSAASISRTSRPPSASSSSSACSELMDIPVFHDDQHGTAIIAAAGLINALDLTGRDVKDDQDWWCNGAGAAGDRLRRTASRPWASAARERHPLRHQGRASGRAAPRA